MWDRTILMFPLFLKVFSIFSPGVEVKLAGHKLQFKCKSSEYFKELMLLDSDFYENISLIEFINCFEGYSESVNLFSDKKIFAIPDLKFIVIKTKVNLKIMWHENTLNNLYSLMFESHETTTQRLQLNEFKSLKRLEIIMSGKYKNCGQYKSNDSKLN